MDALAAAAAPPGLICGYASLFDAPDMAGDVVLRGAFAASLARRRPGAVRMLWQHDPGQPVGRWLDIREDARGLFVRGQLNLGVRRAAELYALVRQGALDGLSIGFRAAEASRDAVSGMRRLRRIDLWEISLVTFPMQPGARLLAPAPAAEPLRRAGAGPALPDVRPLTTPTR